MANMRAIRTRIKSVKNTQQITKAMKMVAVSKLRRTQAGMAASRPFADKSQEIMNTLLASGSAKENRFIKPHKEVKKVCYVLFVGNRGLCGMYNSAVLHFMQDIAENEKRECSVVVCGRWGKDVIAKSGLNVIKTFTELSDTPNSVEALELSEYLKQMFLNGETDEVHLVYEHYVSALSQKPTVEQLLPAKPVGDSSDGEKDIIFEPDAASVLESILQLYINNKVFSVMLDAKCGEHSARMTAMTAATDNTNFKHDTFSFFVICSRQFFDGNCWLLKTNHFLCASGTSRDILERSPPGRKCAFDERTSVSKRTFCPDATIFISVFPASRCNGLTARVHIQMPGFPSPAIRSPKTPTFCPFMKTAAVRELLHNVKSRTHK